MSNNFMAVKRRCGACDKDFMPAHQSDKCPHERLVDLMSNKQQTPDEGLLLILDGHWENFLMPQYRKKLIAIIEKQERIRIQSILIDYALEEGNKRFSSVINSPDFCRALKGD